jgi:hypothetical protein
MNVFFTLISSVVGRVLAALGMGIITYNGASVLMDYFIAQIQTQFTGTPESVLQIITLFGIPESMSIILGAYVSSIPLLTFKKMGFL